MFYIRTFFFSIQSIFVAIFTLLLFPFNYKGKPVNVLMKLWCIMTLLIYGVKVSVSGAENIKNDKGKVYVSNHASYLDIFVLLAKIPDNVRIIYKKELNRMPLIGWAMMAAGFVSIDRSNVRSSLHSLAQAAKKIRNGLSLVIFPEGTRSYDGSIGEFKRGMFVLAEKAEAQIIPVTIKNTFNLMPRTGFKVKPGKVELIIHKPLQFNKDKSFINEIREIIKKGEL